jgi:hypothetical protein
MPANPNEPMSLWPDSLRLSAAWGKLVRDIDANSPGLAIVRVHELREGLDRLLPLLLAECERRGVRRADAKALDPILRDMGIHPAVKLGQGEYERRRP